MMIWTIWESSSGRREKIGEKLWKGSLRTTVSITALDWTVLKGAEWPVRQSRKEMRLENKQYNTTDNTQYSTQYNTQ